MPRQEIPFNGPAYTDISRFISGQECVNWFLRPTPEKDGFVLVGTPGLESWVDLGTNAEVRGSLPTPGFLYAVSGKSFFRVNPSGTATEVGSGTIVTETGIVSMATNGVDVTFVDGGNCYVYDIAADTLTKVSDEDFLGGTRIIYIAGYYFVNRPGSQEMHQGTFNDGSSWPGFFDSAGQASDDILDIIDDHAELMAIGSRSIEPWYNAGLSGFILARRPGAFIEQGTPAKFSSAKANNAFFFLGQDKNGSGHVFQVLGLQPKTISTPGIEYQISSLSDISDAIGFTYEQDGQTFYVLTFPGDDRTFVYDTGVAQWHERSSVITDASGKTRNGRWRANTHAFFDGNNIIGDFANGKLYKMKSDVYDEDGQNIIRTRKAPIIRKNQNSITINELQILHEPGVGISTGNASDTNPHDQLSWSTDGGFEFGNEIHVPIGKLGEYKNRAITPPLGQGRNWVLKLKNSTKTKQVIIGAFADIEIDLG